MKFLHALSAIALIASGLVVDAAKPTKTLKKRQGNSPGFVKSEGGEFRLDGKPFYFVGTTAYWLQQLNSEDDIKKTLTDIASRGIKVVRTWGFNDVVGTPPSHGTYITLWNNGVPTYNEEGFKRLDFIISTADSLGLKIQLVLTNNWVVDSSTLNATSTYKKFARGFFSNDYGGIDTYVQQLAPGSTHDAFYTNPTVIAAFKQYLDKIVARYVNSPAIFSWEIANDPRCRGALNFAAGPDCKPQTITKWTGEIATYIKKRDPNHMTASGDAGFYCLLDEADATKCQKINPIPPPPAQVSQTSQKRSLNGLPKRKGHLTKRQLLAERTAKEKARLHAARAEYVKKNGPRGGPKIRGRWAMPVDVPFKTRYLGKRQDGSDTDFGSSYDGSEGVDTEDIMGNADIDFSSFQFYPDQNTYSQDSGQSTTTEQSQGVTEGTGGENYDQTVEDGNDWIEEHASSANTYGKPVSLNGFGIVGEDSSNYYQPFDSNTVGADSDAPITRRAKKKKYSSKKQRAKAYKSWLSTAIKRGVNGVTHYQWGQNGLESQGGSVVDDSNDYHKGSDSSNGYSPDDGYASYDSDTKQQLQEAANEQNQKSNSGQDSS
ncbi:hypothetical protein FRC03_012220 [Tulasnella sp. 419]|nr:hypothetical protein FRC03_012220 [Tulasnella sp. 419]